MANLIIKPTSGGSLILQDEGGDAAVTVGATGNTTLAGTANNIGTVTAGTIASSVTLPSSAAILQVVSTTKTDTFSISTNHTWTDITGMSVAITPSATSSKILITGVTYWGNVSGDVLTRIHRSVGNTRVGTGADQDSRTASGTGGSIRNTYELVSHPFNFLDSPSTTSAITYKLQVFIGSTSYMNRSNDDANNVNAERTSSTITVMEIKG